MMCTVCRSESVSQFVFPKYGEDLHDWFHRIEEIEHMELAMMHHDVKNIAVIEKSYALQGFTYYNVPNVLNILIIRDLIFVTYSDEFKKIMDWHHE